MIDSSRSQHNANLKRRSARLFLLVIFLFSFLTLTKAQYRFDTYSTDNGLPQNSVHAILQTREGYLWFTTFDGLIRYDGVRLVVFDKATTPGLVSNRFDSLYETPDGVLWAGTQDGGLTRYENGTFKTYTSADGLPSNNIQGLCDDGVGGIQVWTPKGVARWSNGRFISDEVLSRYTGTTMIATRDKSGALWFLSKGALHQLKDGQVSTYSLDSGVEKSISCIYIDHQNRVWLGTGGGKLYRFEDGHFIVPSFNSSLPKALIWSIHEDRAGNFWIATYGGLVKISAQQVTVFTVANGLPSDRVVCVYEDREGSLWIGTTNHGFALVRHEAVRFISKTDGLSGINVYPILEDDAGVMWVGTWDGGLNRYKDGAFTSLLNQPGFTRELITALRQDRKGRVWVGLYSGIGRVEEGVFTNLTKELGLDKQPVFVIYEDRSGTIWLGTRVGLYSIRGEEIKRYTTADGLTGDEIRDILEDQTGDLWIATYGGVTRFRDGRFESFSTQHGLPSNYVRTLFSDNHGTLWIGTYDGGLSRFRDGKFVNYTTADGLFSNGVFRILDDGLGNFWMSCNRGIFRVSKEQLEEFAAGKLRRVTSISFGKHEGLASTECNGGQQPAGTRARDGKLWFPTQGGIAVIDPAEITPNPNPPPVLIEEALVDRNSVALEPQVQIGPGEENLEIRYTGLSFINAQNMAFRYRMEGLDNDWIEAGTRRSVQYAHLPPGRYTFSVIAANADGVWNNTGASLVIVVVPPFWRTWWFMGLVSLLLMGVAYTFYRYQVSRLSRAHAMQQAFSQQLIELQEGERKRIAAGLHDSLGQHLLIIKNRALLGLQTPANEGEDHTQLEEISNLSSQALDEVREIAYDLHPYQIDRLGLTKAIQAMVRKVAAASEIEFSTDIDNIDGVFPSDSEINIYRIVQESINNVLKHSQARSANVSIKREPRSVEISVSDDGKGFPGNAATSGRSGFGLIGISERARMLGGTQTFSSTPGEGSTITVKLELTEKQ